MEAKTLKALHGSIAKWQKIVLGTGKDGGDSNCPLCKLYNYDGLTLAQSCRGCPVMARTKKQYCGGTPYSVWLNSLMSERRFENKAFTLNQTRAAAKMLFFLQSLVPLNHGKILARVDAA
jgi:hypothetical protein